MRKFLFFVLLLAVAAGVVLSLRYPREAEWSTDSEAALEALRAGLDAGMKFYGDDARQHFSRAVELDQGFLVAKERLGRSGVSAQRRRELVEELRRADLSTVNARERFLIRYWLAQVDEGYGENKTAEAILEARLEEAPEDPFALHQAALRARREGRRDEAKTLNQRLIEVDPNWVYAQNMLGYLAMAAGDFREAEERFRTYQYIAPDQANPHDSMGELLLLLGRYEEAERELEMALAIRPTFTASYTNLLWIAVFEQDAGKARAILGRVETNPELPAEMSNLKNLVCLRDMHLGYLTGAWEEAWRSVCAGQSAYTMMSHLISLILGERERAADLRAAFHEQIKGRHGDHKPPSLQARALHIDGNSLLAAGEPRRAAEHFRQADGLLLFDGGDYQALLKLRNLGHLAAALEAAGEGSAAAAWQRVAEINPRIRPFLETGLRPLIQRADRENGSQED